MADRETTDTTQKLEPLRATDTSTDQAGVARENSGFWRTGLLLVTSAALGGIAVAIWNRRALERMHQEYENPERLRREDIY